MKGFVFRISAVMAVLLCWQAPTRAIVVTADGTPVFRDDFEADTLGSTPVNAIIGYWTNPEGIAVVQNSAPTAYEGTQYMHLVRPAELLMQANFTDTLGNPKPVATGQDLQLAMAVYADGSGSNGPMNIQLRSTSGILDLAFLAKPNGTVDLFDYVYGVTTGTVPWVANQWQVWSVDYVVGSNSLTLTIDGNSQTFTNVHGTDPIDRVLFTGRTGSNDIYDIDSLPLPVVLGDFNRDTHADAKDIAAMQLALSNLSSYESTYHVTPTQFSTFSDINGDGKFTNSDLQSYLNYLKTGHGSATAVPEPSTLILLGAGGLIAIASSIKNKFRKE